MGSATVTNTKQTQTNMAETKFVKLLKKLIPTNKRKGKDNSEKNVVKNKNAKDDESDEDSTFYCYHIEDRIDSVSSEDSGFSDNLENYSNENSNAFQSKDETVVDKKYINHKEIKSVDKHKNEHISKAHTEDKSLKESNVTECFKVLSIKDEEETRTTEEVTETLDNLTIQGKKGKKKQIVYISRGKDKSKPVCVMRACPYSNGKQIQINRQTFSGGLCIENSTQPTKSKIEEADEIIESYIEQKRQEESMIKQIEEDLQKEAMYYSNDLSNAELEEFSEILLNQIVQNEEKEVQYVPPMQSEHQIAHYYSYNDTSAIYPSPPRSDSVPSPLNGYSDPNNLLSDDLGYEVFREVDSLPRQASNDPILTTIDNIMSPAQTVPVAQKLTPPRSDAATPPSDYSTLFSPETPVLHEIDNHSPISKRDVEKKPRERKQSCSMTMKQYKDMQKQIEASVTRYDCCKEEGEKKSCESIFREYAEKLKVEERSYLSSKMAALDIDKQFRLLHNLVIDLSKDCDEDAKLYYIFSIVCHRLVAEKPSLFTSQLGLSVLKACVFRCNRRPLLTRYIIKCIRSAIRKNEKLIEGKEHVFNEVDANGDTIPLACARAGDQFADVLSEMVRSDSGQLPLFDMAHTNRDGYTALHLACIHHSAQNPCLRTVHILLKHAHCDLWKGDNRGGDTALHMAVNSANCELRMVLMIFRHVDHSRWHELANVQNRSCTGPREYARSSLKSTSRQNYPPEVYEFLNKCRKPT